MAKKKSRQYRVRDLSAAKPKRSGGRNEDGSRKGGVTPAFRAGVVNGDVFLLTRTGRKVDLRTHAGRRFVTLIGAMDHVSKGLVEARDPEPPPVPVMSAAPALLLVALLAFAGIAAGKFSASSVDRG